MMKKNSKCGYLILAIAFILFNIIAFAIPTAKTLTFWVAYAFTAIAFIAQAIIWNKVFSCAVTLKSKFLGFPIVHIGIVYLIIQLIVFVVFMTLPLSPVWIAIVVSALICGIAAICMITTNVGRKEIDRVEEKVQEKTGFIKLIQADVDCLYEAETDPIIKSAYMNLSEKIRFSDPMSSDSLSNIEHQITLNIDQLKNVDNDSRMELIRKIMQLVTERNVKCKILK